MSCQFRKHTPRVNRYTNREDRFPVLGAANLWDMMPKPKAFFDGCLSIDGTPMDAAFTVPATSGWQEYRVMPIDELTLSPGIHACVLRAITELGEPVVNVRSSRMTRR